MTEDLVFYQDINKWKSRRSYVMSLTRSFGSWLLIKTDTRKSQEDKQEMFKWCQSLSHPWGCDTTRRRFYFANADDATLFKLTWR